MKKTVLLVLSALLIAGVPAANATDRDELDGYYTMTVKSGGRVIDRQVFSDLSELRMRGTVPFDATAVQQMCRTATSRLTYNDFLHDIYSISISVQWCGNGTGGLFTPVNWLGRDFAVHEYGWSWVGWRGSDRKQDNHATYGWSQWWVKGQFHHNVAQIDGYPRYTMRVRSNIPRGSGLTYVLLDKQAY